MPKKELLANPETSNVLAATTEVYRKLSFNGVATFANPKPSPQENLNTN
jgi:hypothetical protein